MPRHQTAEGFLRYSFIQMDIAFRDLAGFEFCKLSRIWITYDRAQANGHSARVAKTPSARQQCWPESFCKSGKFSRQVHYWLKNFRILCNTKYPDNMQNVYAHLSQIWKLTRFTRFIRKVFATKILLSGKFSLFVTLCVRHHFEYDHYICS